MAERAVEIVGHGSAGGLRLRLLGSACDGCSGGCAGRCSLFATNAAGEFELSLPEGMRVVPGQQMRLCLDDATLRRAAWRGYGRVWLGIVLGSLAGWGIGQLWGQHADVLTLLGLVCGTFIAVRSSKRHLPEPQLIAPGRPSSFVPSTSDRP